MQGCSCSRNVEAEHSTGCFYSFLFFFSSFPYLFKKCVPIVKNSWIPGITIRLLLGCTILLDTGYGREAHRTGYSSISRMLVA